MSILLFFLKLKDFLLPESLYSVVRLKARRFNVIHTGTKQATVPWGGLSPQRCEEQRAEFS